VPEGKFYSGYSFFKKGPKEYNGMRLHRVRVVPRGKNNFLLLAINCASFALNSLLHVPRLALRQFDCVLSYQISPVSLVVPAIAVAKLKRIPHFCYVLDIWPESMFFLLNMAENSDHPKWFRSISRRVSAWIYRRADQLLISSRGMASRLATYDIPNANVHYLPNVADDFQDVPRDAALAAELGLAGKFIITFAGNIGRAQGVDMLLDAVVRTRDLEGLHWLILGDGTEMDNVRSIVSQEGLSHRVTLTGWIPVSQVHRYLSLSSALVVMLKKRDIFSLTVPSKLMTYLSAAKPILAWLDGESAEIVTQSGAGFTAAAEDVEAFCQCVRQLYSLPEETRQNMGLRGKAYCQEHFDRMKLMDWLSGFLEDQTKKKR
jgi:glycosyltransferase involved in cell wall biosynthesis